MAHIVEFRIQGYRAISKSIVLSSLGNYVAIYGDNAVGKTSVIRAVTLLGRLCATHPTQLLGTGRPWPMDGFFERFGEDSWMFNALSGGQVEIGAITNMGLKVSFKLTRTQDGIEVVCNRAKIGETDLMADMSAAQSNLDGAERNSASLPDDAVASLHLDHMTHARDEIYDRFAKVLSPLTVALGTPPVVPVLDATRTALFDAVGSSSAAIRAAVRSAFRGFGSLFPALGKGELDVLSNPPLHEKDLAWVNDTSSVLVDPIPLDHLGGGVQSVVATLASLILSRSAVVCLEEPEAFVGVCALDGMATIFRTASTKKICEQVWIATHAMALVGAEDPIVTLERSGGEVSVRQGKALQIGGQFAQPPPGRPADRFGRLEPDGSVRLPQALIERAGLRTGEFVYFEDGDSGIRILSGKQVDIAIPELDEP